MSGSFEGDSQLASGPSRTPRRAVAWPGLEELRRREAALESEWGELQEQGFDY